MGILHQLDTYVDTKLKYVVICCLSVKRQIYTDSSFTALESIFQFTMTMPWFTDSSNDRDARTVVHKLAEMKLFARNLIRSLNLIKPH